MLNTKPLTSFNSVTATLALWVLALCFFVSPISVSLTTITYLLAFVLVLFSGDWKNRWEKLKQNKAAWSFLILFALFLLGITYTTSTMHWMLKDLHKRHWLLFTPFFIIFLCDEKWRQRLLNAFLSVMTITLALSYFKVVTHFNIYHFLPKFVKPMPAASVFESHINQSFAMSIAAFICGYRYLFDSDRRLIYLGLFILMGFNILFLNEGRTGYGIFIALFCYLGFIRFKTKGLIYSGLICLILLATAFATSHNMRDRLNLFLKNVHKYGHSQQVTSMGQRLEMLKIAKHMIAGRPIFGYGTGGIRTALPHVVPAKDRVQNPSLDYVENIYLNFLMQFGVFGFLILCLAITIQIKQSFLLPDQYKHLMQAVLITILLGGCFNAFLVNFTTAHIYALFAALCFSAYQCKEGVGAVASTSVASS